MDDAAVPALILAVVAALIAAVPPTLAAMAAYRAAGAALTSSQQGAVLTAAVVVKAEEQAARTEVLKGAVDQVHTLTNSNLSAVKAELVQASQQITNLAAIVVELREERSKAQIREALGTVPTSHVPAPAPAPPIVVVSTPSETSLKEITTNTAETVAVLKDQDTK